MGRSSGGRSACDAIVEQHQASVDHARTGEAQVDQAEFFATFYGPTSRALATLGADRGTDLKADMVEVARRFDVSDDDTLVLRQDYLEAVIHKPATP